MLAFSLALRFLRAGRGQTLLIIIGIAIAIAAQIFIGLLITSLQKTLVNRTIGNQPQITITSAEDAATISDWDNRYQRNRAGAGSGRFGHGQRLRIQ